VSLYVASFVRRPTWGPIGELTISDIADLSLRGQLSTLNNCTSVNRFEATMLSSFHVVGYNISKKTEDNCSDQQDHHCN
jgi:hypothetical protein